MSLIAWYPLNGDTLDYSGNGYNGNFVGTPTITAGKTGSAYSFTSDSMFVEVPMNNELKNRVFGKSNVFSLSGWVYATTKENWACIVNNANGGSWSNTTAGLWISAANGISFTMGSAVGGNPAGSYCYIHYPTVSLNTWYHVTGVADGTTMKLYINGNLVSSIAISLPYGRNQISDSITIGRRSTSSAPTLKGKINDVRIYDHALSEKEVKEIAKAKILHYTFDDFQEPTENLMTNTNIAFGQCYNGSSYGFGSATNIQETFYTTLLDKNNVTKVSRINSDVSQSDYVYRLTSSTFAASSTYTYSFWYYGTIGSSITPYCLGTTRMNCYYLDDFGAWVGGSSSITIPVTTYKWQRIVIKMVNASTTGTAEGIGYIILHSNATTGTLANTEYWAFSEFQLEKKPYSTPYTLGFRDGTIKDISGYRNDAIINLDIAPQWVSNSKIGNGAYKFNGSQYIKKPTSSRSYIPAGIDYTQSLWVYIAALPTGRNVILDDNNRWEHWIAINTNGTVYAAYYNAAQYGCTSTNTLSLNAWHHIVVSVVSGVSMIMYVDGVVWAQNLAIGGVHSKIFDDVVIGANGGDSLEKFTGKIDDVRIYATALSSDDILELYQTRGSVDNHGNLYSGEFFENSKDIYSKNLIRNGFGEWGSNVNNTSLVWVANTDIEGCEGVFQRTGGYADVTFSDMIPVNTSDTYEVTHWSRVITGETNARYYSTVRCYDEFKREIRNQNMNSWGTTYRTTLATQLINGATTIELLDGSAWSTLNFTASPYVYAAFCTDSAYDNYTYMPTYQRVSSVSGNILTLTSAWTGGSIPVGTKVCATRDGSTYVYLPASYSLISSTWTKFTTKTSVGTFRPATRYIKIGMLANYSGCTGTTITQFGGFSVKNLTSVQSLINVANPNISDRGVFWSQQFYEVGLPIRYIRDHINGSTANAASHWCQISAFNRVGADIALGKSVSGPTSYQPTNYIWGTKVVTNGIVATSPYAEGGTACTIDLGFIEDIVSVKVWHYYGDGRTYHSSKLEVSEDGVSWITIFDSSIEGEYVETASGHEVIIYPKKLSLCKSGDVYSAGLQEGY